MQAPVTLAELEAAMVSRGGLYEFVRLAWSEVEPAPFVDSPHIRLVCAHLEAVSRGECLRLVINIPPGCSKSLLTGVFWPAWDWTRHNPGRKWMAISFDQALTWRDADRLRRLVASPWYQERFGHKATHNLERYRLQAVGIDGFGDREGVQRRQGRQSSAVGRIWTTGGGMRLSTMVGGRATGWHADIQVLDDPTKPKDVQAGGETARKALERTRLTWRSTFSTRKANPKSFARVIVMQRLHSDDLSATAEAEGYTVLRLPMEYNPKRHCKTPWGEDWRTDPGELLAPDRFDAITVAEGRRDLGPRDAAAQYDQDPTPDAGTVFARDWLTRRHNGVPAGGVWFMSVDCTFKGTDTADFVVAQVWARKGPNFYLADQTRARMGFAATVQAVCDLRAKWKQVRAILVEEAANGAAVIETLQKTIPGVIAVKPQGGKEARANAVTPALAAGQVFLPDAEWTADLVDELTKFPLGANDDQVDALTQALAYGLGRLKGLAAVAGERGRLRVRPTVSTAQIGSELAAIRALGKVTITGPDPSGCLIIDVTGDLDLARYAITHRSLGVCLG